MPKFQENDQYPLSYGSLSAALQPWRITSFTFAPIERGVENRTVRIETDTGTYVVRIYRRGSVTETDLFTEVSFVRELHRNGLPVPEIVKTTEGRDFARIHDGETDWYVLLMTLMPGTHTPAYTQETVQQIGQAMATLHTVSIRYCDGKAMIPPVLIRDKLIDSVNIEAETDTDIRAFLQRIKRFTIIPRGLPCALIHRDFTRGNLLFDQDRLTAILDFEALKYSAIIEDPAVMIWNLLFNMKFKQASPQLLKTFLDSYQSIRPIPQSERMIVRDFLVYRTYILGTIDYAMGYQDEVRSDIEMERLINEYDTSSLFT